MAYIFFETCVPPGRNLVRDLGTLLNEASAGVRTIKRDAFNPFRIAVRAKDVEVVENVLKMDRFFKARP